MFQKFIRQSLKPLKRISNDKAYRTWLRLFDDLKHDHFQSPVQVKAMNYLFNVHNGHTFINQFESIFVNQIYRFQSTSSSPVIIDCGANMGTSVMYFKQLFTDAKILAFEPDRSIFDVLQKNITQNKIKDVSLFNKAVWIEDKEMYFSSSKAQSGALITNETEVKVECVRLKSVLKNFKTVDFLKLDIEGAELPVMQDIASELHKVEHLFIEYHSYSGKDQELSKLLLVLEENGFRYYLGGNEVHGNGYQPVIEEGMDLTIDIFARKK